MIRTLFLQQIDRTPRKREAWDILRPIIFGVGLMFALIPSFYPITDHEFVILPLMALVIFITHLALTLRTLSVAASVRSWGEGTEAWDVLAMTGISARQFIWGTHRTVVQRVWFDHVVFSLLRLGLAVGMAQLLHMINAVALQNYYLEPLFYGSNYDPSKPLTPDLAQLLIGGILLVGFAFLEAYLLVGLYLLVRLWREKDGQARHLGTTLTVRALLVVGVIAIWTALQPIKTLARLEWFCEVGSYCSNLAYPSVERSKITADGWLLYYNLDTMRMAFSVLGDNATLLVADLMRPSYGIMFMVNAIPQISIAVGVYWGLIRLSLWGARRLAVKRGMLP